MSAADAKSPTKAPSPLTTSPKKKDAYCDHQVRNGECVRCGECVLCVSSECKRVCMLCRNKRLYIHLAHTHVTQQFQFGRCRLCKKTFKQMRIPAPEGGIALDCFGCGYEWVRPEGENIGVSECGGLF